MKRRGRAVGSVIRDNIVELLYHMKQAHAYEIYQKYKKVYGPVNIRSVYYNLTKGKELGVFNIAAIQKVEGNFSWGSVTERTLYGLSEKANPRVDMQVKSKLEKLN